MGKPAGLHHAEELRPFKIKLHTQERPHGPMHHKAKLAWSPQYSFRSTYTSMAPWCAALSTQPRVMFQAPCAFHEWSWALLDLLQINYKYAPKEGHAWNKDYHNKLYNLTDAAIRGGYLEGLQITVPLAQADSVAPVHGRTSVNAHVACMSSSKPALQGSPMQQGLWPVIWFKTYGDSQAFLAACGVGV